MIHNIVFDMGNVLLGYHPLEDLQQLFGDSADAEAIYRELNKGSEWLLMDEGILTEEEGFSRVLKRLPGLEEKARFYWECWDKMMTDIPGMMDLTTELHRKGYPLYILSNVSLRFYRLWDSFPVFQNFQGYLISAEEKLVKPDQRIYYRFCKKFGIKSEECLFFDDRQENIDGAIAAGFSGKRFENAENLRIYLKSVNIL